MHNKPRLYSLGGGAQQHFAAFLVSLIWILTQFCPKCIQTGIRVPLPIYYESSMIQLRSFSCNISNKQRNAWDQKQNHTLSSGTKWQRFPAGDTLCSVSPAGSRRHFVLLDKDESCPTANLSNIGRPNGPAYSTGELLNTPLLLPANVMIYDLIWGAIVELESQTLQLHIESRYTDQKNVLQLLVG